jgi:cellulose biosynthesis protein BcsQ
MKSLIFANGKGGVGKTSLTIMFGNYLKSLGHNIVIVDCDMQGTGYRTFLASDEPEYDVIAFDPGQSLDEWEVLIEEISAFDYVLFDIPGSMFQGGIVRVLSLIDKMIIPTSMGPKDLDGTRVFINETVKQLTTPPEFRIVFNKLKPYTDVDAREIEKCLIENRESKVFDFLGISKEQNFKTIIRLEEAAIEKSLSISYSHHKIIDRYNGLMGEMLNYLDN